MRTRTSKARPLLRSAPRKRGPRPDSPPRGKGKTKARPLGDSALYRLMTWLSPAYPVGAFSYSSGIEWAVEGGDITDAETLRRWLAAMLTKGAGMSDGIVFAATYRATETGDDPTIAEIAELAAAFVPSAERYHETIQLGRAFIEVTRAAWPCDALLRLPEIWNGPIAYPVAVAVSCAGHGIALESALHAFMTAVTANWISAGVRLIPLGHTDGQRVLGALEPVVATTVRSALAASLDDLASATFRADLASVRHETQYTRLFRS
jgi:urease accessory protein